MSENNIDTALGLNTDSYNQEKISTTNSIANVLRGLGWVTIILGFILGALMGGENDSYLSHTPSWLLMLPYWIGGFVSGMCMLGFSEIINLLHQINLKIK